MIVLNLRGEAVSVTTSVRRLFDLSMLSCVTSTALVAIVMAADINIFHGLVVLARLPDGSSLGGGGGRGHMSTMACPPCGAGAPAHPANAHTPGCHSSPPPPPIGETCEVRWACSVFPGAAQVGQAYKSKFNFMCATSPPHTTNQTLRWTCVCPLSTRPPSVCWICSIAPHVQTVPDDAS